MGLSWESGEDFYEWKSKMPQVRQLAEIALNREGLGRFRLFPNDLAELQAKFCLQTI